jgi:hypothetical protein
MYVLESRVREATASVRRTQLAVVRRKSTKERYPLALLEPFSLLFSTTGVDQGDL